MACCRKKQQAICIGKRFEKSFQKSETGSPVLYLGGERVLQKTFHVPIKTEYTFYQVPSLGYAANTRKHAGPVRQDLTSVSER